MRYIKPPPCPRSAPESPTKWTYLGNPDNEASRRHPYQMPQTTWLFWTQRSSSFTLSTIQIYRLFALLLKVSPATLLRKLISATCSFSHYPKLLDNGEGPLQHSAFTADTSPASLSLSLSLSIDILIQFYLLHISAVCLAFCVVCHTWMKLLSAARSYEWF